MTDRLDAQLVQLLRDEPRVGVLEASRRLGVARGTVQARLDRMQARGVITGFGPDIDPVALGYGVTAFVTLEIRQAGGHDPVAHGLAVIPEVLEVHTITGTGDMLCRVVAKTNADLQRVIDAIVDVAGVVRASTVIALARPASLPGAAVGPRGRGRPGRPGLGFARLTGSAGPRLLTGLPARTVRRRCRARPSAAPRDHPPGRGRASSRCSGRSPPRRPGPGRAAPRPAPPAGQRGRSSAL